MYAPYIHLHPVEWHHTFQRLQLLFIAGAIQLSPIAPALKVVGLSPRETKGREMKDDVLNFEKCQPRGL
eukprot:3755135-Amphidinium_carterae.1